MDIIAKIRCDVIEAQPAPYKQKTVMFNAVIDGSPENESFAKATPSLNLKMWISDETPAADHFVAGKEYYIIFKEVE